MYRFDYFFPVVVVFFSLNFDRMLILVSITMITFFCFFMDRNWIMVLYFNEWIDHSGLVFILAIQSMMIMMMMTIITHTHMVKNTSLQWWSVFFGLLWFFYIPKCYYYVTWFLHDDDDDDNDYYVYSKLACLFVVALFFLISMILFETIYSHFFSYRFTNKIWNKKIFYFFSNLNLICLIGLIHFIFFSFHLFIYCLFSTLCRYLLLLVIIIQ